MLERDEMQILPSNLGYTEAARYAQRFPKGWKECSMLYATHIGWFGSALPYEICQDGKSIDVYVGLGYDETVRVQVTDLHIFGMIFIASDIP
jgi:hypothetical protein